MKNTELKPINTTYKGYNFRSRLEARWAVFFDSLGIEWEYEFEGYNLDGIKYLPDFYLPTFCGGMYVEVKPKALTPFEFEKAERLARISGKEVWLAIGVPEPREYKIVTYNNQDGVFTYPAVPLIDKAKNENRMYAWPDDLVNSEGYLADDRFLGLKASEMHWHIFNAVESAKSARFEFHGHKSKNETINPAPSPNAREIYEFNKSITNSNGTISLSKIKLASSKT